MSTKINVRSPYYLSYGEPPVPLPTFNCGYANAENFTVDQSGAVSLPTLEYGYIQSYDSDAADFSNGAFAEVSTNTSRTLNLTIVAPSGFDNEGDAVICQVSATQEAKPVVCSSVVFLNGNIPTQNLNTGGQSVTVDYSSYFGGSTSDFLDIIVSNDFNLDTSINDTDEEITITSKSTAGVFSTNIERIDKSTGCSARQAVSVVITSVATFDCSIANLLGGAVASDGTLTTPSTIGTITATKETSGGASVTSIAANNTGSDISVTLFYDVTVPSGYTNSGNTIECSVTYTQESNIVLPTFTCSNIDLDDQAILEDGSVVAGVAKWYHSGGRTNLTIDSFTPTTFPLVDSVTNRDVTFTIQTPDSGFTNSGSTIDCSTTIKQPAQATAPVPFDCANAVYKWRVSAKTLDDPFLFGLATKQTFNAYIGYVVDDGNPTSTWDGKSICINGVPFGQGSGRYWIYVNKTKLSYSQAQTNTKEYFLFMNGTIIQAVYLRDWTTRTVVRL